MATPILPGLSLTDNELEISYILASGPGGQNVYKVATAAQLRFDAARSASLPERVRLLEIAGSRATRDGVVVIWPSASVLRFAIARIQSNVWPR